MAGHDSRYRLVSITDQHFFPIPDELDMSAEAGFQIADVYGLHAAIILDMTMLVISR
jgi:hypothetical protein